MSAGIEEFIEGMKEFFSSHAKADIYTTLPAVVESVHDYEGKWYIDASPIVNRLWDDGRLIKRATVYDIPVLMPSGGGGTITFPVKKGDGVVLHFSMRDIDNWRDGDGQTDEVAKTSRSHSLTDAFATTGLFNAGSEIKPSGTNTEWRFQKSQVVQKPNGEVVITNPAGDLTYKEDGTLEHYSGAKITPDGDVLEKDGVSLRNHTHQVIITSGSSAGTYTSEKAQ